MFEKTLAEFTESYKSIVIVPSTSLDALLAAGVLFKKLLDHGLDVRLSLNTRIVIDYPDDPVILIGLPAINEKRQLSISTSNSDTTYTGIVVSTLDKLVGVDNVDRLLAVLAGLYRGLYDFKTGGFRGIESDYLRGLISDKIVTEIPGLRLWGVRRVGLALAMARTLMPYMPGITGNYDKASKIVVETFKVQDPNSIRQKEIKGSESRDSMIMLLKSISEQTKDSSLAYKLLGDFYLSLPLLGDMGEIELHELLGALMVHESLCHTCPLDVSMSVIEKNIFVQALAIYNVVIDKTAPRIASCIEEIRRNGQPELPGAVKRPDLILDILSYSNLLPRDRAVVVLSEAGRITVLRELIRLGVRPEEAYEKCREDQICPLE